MTGARAATNPDAEIRAFGSADVTAAIALWRRTEGLGLNGSDTPAALEIFLGRNPGLSAVAIADGALVGAVLCGHDGRRGTLHHLAVARAWRGRGLASAMIEHCSRALVAAGVPRCNLFIYDDNESGAAFWAGRGWQRMTTWGVMQKKL